MTQDCNKLKLNERALCELKTSVNDINTKLDTIQNGSGVKEKVLTKLIKPSDQSPVALDGITRLDIANLSETEELTITFDTFTITYPPMSSDCFDMAPITSLSYEGTTPNFLIKCFKAPVTEA